MRITNWNMVKKAMDMRTEMLHETRNIINSSPKLKDEAILIAARNKVAKQYKLIADELNMDIVFGSGGAQNDKMRKLDRLGINYIHIEPKHLSKEEDILNGF